MSTLYLLGGPPRTAKTTIMSGLAKEKGIAFMAADAVEHGIRNVFTNEPHQMLRDIEFSGSAEWKTSITNGGERKAFSNRGAESDFTLQAIVGMLDYYRRNDESVAFEGAAFTPQWISGLDPTGFTVRAAFVGFTNPNHADQILSFARNNSHDWINDWLEKDDGDETNVREWVTRQSEKGIELKAEAESNGYRFFDISDMPFDEYVSAVQQYLSKLN